MSAPGGKRVKSIQSNPFLYFLLYRKGRVLRHILLIFFILLTLYGGNTGYSFQGEVYLKLLLFFVLVFLPYVNMYFFVPQLLFKGYYFVYVISIVVIISLFYFLAFFIRNLLKPFVIDSQVASNSSGDFFFFLVIFSVIIAASTAIKLFQRSIIDGERINSLENLRLQSELDHLKNQVNPHFLFNTLNNANVLITKDPEKASTVLHSLSHLLRYQLYDSNRPLVLLNGEVKFLNNFLSLEKIRRDFFDFRITTTTNISKTLVPPYLFIAFVENAVKHSADPLSRSYVYIDVSIVESSLFFSCINSKPNFALNVNEAYGGLGLANVKRRLELLFAGKYTLNINEQIDKYQVHLALEL